MGDQLGRVAGDEGNESEDVRPRPLHLRGEQARHVRAQLRDEEVAGLLSREGGGAQKEGGREDEVKQHILKQEGNGPIDLRWQWQLI